MCEIKLPDKFNGVLIWEPDGVRSSVLILCVTPLVHQVVNIFHLVSHPVYGARVTTTAWSLVLKEHCSYCASSPEMKQCHLLWAFWYQT